ncbi:hypothetical protein DY000_02030205 [Brassica cretica]|uniref:CCHC-type domain-containing protein n=1 Tax=Brassica cretica TaxID=69181 RepID=A0ABQ7DVK6_BRACR|nr:hypothetical protein DY000_02030205 [Brassica cretica]
MMTNTTKTLKRLETKCLSSLTALASRCDLVCVRVDTGRSTTFGVLENLVKLKSPRDVKFPRDAEELSCSEGTLPPRERGEPSSFSPRDGIGSSSKSSKDVEDECNSNASEEDEDVDLSGKEDNRGKSVRFSLKDVVKRGETFQNKSKLKAALEMYDGVKEGPKANDIIQIMRMEHGCEISKSLAWDAREYAISLVRGIPEQSFGKILKYLHMLKEANPGTHTFYETDVDGVPEDTWVVPDTVRNANVLAPESRRGAERRRKRRYETVEDKLRSSQGAQEKKRRMCSRCGEENHNRATCDRAI